MSWWDSSQVESQIMRATSSSIPSGEQDLALNLEISDLVRSKEADPKTTLRVLRKRLYDPNPNVQVLTLHLLDLLVKNGGNHFLVELTSKDFISAYVAQLLALQNQNRNPEVVQLMLEYFQTWALASGTKPEASFLREKYEELKARKDVEFPDYVDSVSGLSSSFLESATAPEWTDSELCMKSGQPFTFYNRKHHCRNCGGVFLQDYCSSFRPLPHYGINIPVRVCVDCNARLEQKYQTKKISTTAPNESLAGSTQNATRRTLSSNNADIGFKYREDLAQAINMSLNASKSASKSIENANNTALSHRNIPGDDSDLDEDMKKAIAASLADFQDSHPSSAPDVSISEASDGTVAGYDSNYPHYSQPPIPGSVALLAADSVPKIEPALPPKEKLALESYVSFVQTASPYDAVYNQNLTGLNQDAIRLQPKIITELRSSTEKLSVLEDLHGKLLAISSYYDRLLDAELSSDLGNIVISEETPAQTTASLLPRSNSNQMDHLEPVNSHQNQPQLAFKSAGTETAQFPRQLPNAPNDKWHQDYPTSLSEAQPFSAENGGCALETHPNESTETTKEIEQPNVTSDVASEAIMETITKPLQEVKAIPSQAPTDNFALDHSIQEPDREELKTISESVQPQSPLKREREAELGSSLQNSVSNHEPEPEPEPESESESEYESENEAILIEL